MKKIILLAILLATAITGFSQVGIGTDSPHPSAALEVQSTNLGLLLPRMTSAQMNAISNPSEGLVVYCLDCFPKDVYVFGGTNFNLIGSGATDATSITLSTNSTNFEVGDQITMTVLDNLGYNVTYTSQVTLGGNVIPSTSYTLTSPGNFDVKAIRGGFTSNTVPITVTCPLSNLAGNYDVTVIRDNDGATTAHGIEAITEISPGNYKTVTTGNWAAGSQAPDHGFNFNDTCNTLSVPSQGLFQGFYANDVYSTNNGQVLPNGDLVIYYMIDFSGVPTAYTATYVKQ